MIPDDTGSVRFEPGSGDVPGHLSSLPDPSGGELVVLAVEGSPGGVWAPETAVALVRSWAGALDRLFLVDLGLEDPALHDVLGLANEEGIADVVLYGAAVQRVAQTVDGGDFFFASAGTPVADPSSVLVHERWDGLLDGFHRANATLCAFVSMETPGASSFLKRADRVVVLAAEGVEAAGPTGAEIDALIRPPVEQGTPTVAAPPSDGEPRFDGEPEIVDIATLAPDAPAAGAEVTDIGELAPDEVPEEEAAPEPLGAVGEVPGADDAMVEGPTAEEELPLEEEPAVGAEARSEVVDIGELAPDDAAEETPGEREGAAGGVAAPEPEEAAPGGGGLDERPLLEIGSLAPDAEEDPEPEAGEFGTDEPASGEPGPVHEAMEEEAAFGEGAPGDEEAEEATVEDEPLGVEGFEGDGFPEESVAGQEPGTPAAEGADLAGEEEPGSPEESPAEPSAPGEQGPFGGFQGLDEAEMESGIEDAEAAGEDEGEFGAFDMGSLDARGTEEPEVGSHGDEVRIRSDFGAQEEGEEEEDREAIGVDPGAPEEESDPEAVGGSDGAVEADDFDFGDFSGEMVLEEEEEGSGPTTDEGDDVAAGLGAEELEEDAGDEDFGGLQEEEGGAFGDDLVTGPDFGQGAPDDEWETEDEDEEEVARPGEAELPDQVPEELDSTGGVPGEALADEEAGEDAVPERGKRHPPDTGGRGAGGLLAPLARIVALLALVGGAVLGAHWFDVVRVPGLDPVLVRVLGPAAAARTPEVRMSDPAPVTPVMGYSLTMDAYRDLASATDVADAWDESFEGYLFSVVPVLVEGDVFYRLLAGPARSSEEAEQLRSSLAELLTREDPSSWVVRSTPMAFVLSEHESVDAARSEVNRLAGEGLPAYVLEVVYPGDTVRYRVVAGAYESGEEARILQGMLTEMGLDGARFTERRGRLPE